jgi:hypothetical protein
VKKLEREKVGTKGDLKEAVEQLSQLDRENKKLSDENHLFRRFYMQNMASEDVYGKDEPEYIKKEMANLFKDFNKVINNKDAFIGHGLDELSGIVNKSLMTDPELIKKIQVLYPKVRLDH